MGFHSLTTPTEIANLALQRIGEKTVTLITDSNERARNVNLIFQFELDNLTATYKWRFARKSITIDLPTTSITAFASASATTTTVTSTSHGIVDGESVDISGTTSYDGDFVITFVDVDSFTIVKEFVADDATGTLRWTSDEFEFRFGLPSDLTDIIKVGTGIEHYAVQGPFIVTSSIEDDLILLYDQKISDVSEMPTYFIRLLYMRIGLELVLRREGSQTLIDRFRDELTGVDSEARRLDRGNDFQEDQGEFTILGINPPSRSESNIFPKVTVRQNNG